MSSLRDRYADHSIAADPNLVCFFAVDVGGPARCIGDRGKQNPFFRGGDRPADLCIRKIGNLQRFSVQLFEGLLKDIIIPAGGKDPDLSSRNIGLVKFPPSGQKEIRCDPFSCGDETDIDGTASGG